MIMKPVITIATILLIGISVAHLLRLIYQVEMTVGGFHIPVWLSIFGFIIPMVLALMLWRENRKEFIKNKLSPLKIRRKKDNQ